MGDVAFERTALVAALRIVGKVRPWPRDERQHGLIRIRHDGGRANLISTSLDMQIEIGLPCEADEPGELVAPLATFAPFAEKLPEGCAVVLSPTDTGLVVRGGRSRSTLACSVVNAMAARGESASATHSMPAAALAKGLAAAAPAAIDDNARPHLGGVHLHDAGGSLRFEAQDGTRIHAARQDGTRIHAAAIIPRRAARMIVDLLPEEGDALIAIDERQVQVTAGALRITSALLGGQFPPIDPQLSAVTNRTLRGRADQLLADIDLVMTVANFRDRDFRFDLGPTCEVSAFRVLGGGPEMGAVQLEAAFEGAPLAIGFQFPLVRDALQLFGSSPIAWRMGGAEDATIISSPDHPDVEALVFPFRLVADHQRIAA